MADAERTEEEVDDDNVRYYPVTPRILDKEAVKRLHALAQEGGIVRSARVADLREFAKHTIAEPLLSQVEAHLDIAESYAPHRSKRNGS